MRILFVDDQMEMLDIYDGFLDNEVHGAKYQSDPIKALEIFKNTSFDLVILDHKMPSISGIELARQINKVKETPVILVSAYVTESEIQEFKRDIKYARVLHKPDCFESLSREINKVKYYLETKNGK